MSNPLRHIDGKCYGVFVESHVGLSHIITWEPPPETQDELNQSMGAEVSPVVPSIQTSNPTTSQQAKAADIRDRLKLNLELGNDPNVAFQNEIYNFLCEIAGDDE